MLNNRTISIRSWAIRCCAGGCSSPRVSVHRSPAQAPPTPPGQPAVAATAPVPAGLASRCGAGAGRQARGTAHRGRALRSTRRSRRSPSSSRSRPIWSKTINMLNQKYTIKGRYLKAPELARLPSAHRLRPARHERHHPSGLRRRDALGLPVSPRFASIYRKLSIKPILERLNSPELDPKIRDQAHRRRWALAGPETLLVGLRKTLRFDQKEEDVLDGKKVWILRGTWRTRQGLVGPDGRPVNAVGSCLRTSRWTPRSIWARTTAGLTSSSSSGRKPSALFDTRRMGPDGRPIGAKSSIEKINPSEIRLTYSDVKLNVKIRLEEFAFQAPPRRPSTTAPRLIVKGLDQAISDRRPRKRRARPPRKRAPSSISRSTVPAAAPRRPRPRHLSFPTRRFRARDLSTQNPDSWRREGSRQKMEPTKPGGGAKPSKVEAIKLASQYLQDFRGRRAAQRLVALHRRRRHDPQVPRVVSAGRSRPAHRS